MTRNNTTPTLLERARAGALHLLLSLLVLAASLYLVFGLWYPAPLQIATGVGEIFLLLLTIDLLLGPLLTTVVFKHDRRHFMKDLAVILVLQLTALTYGLYTVAQGRPVWLAFVIDDVEIVRAVDIHPSEAPLNKQFQARLWSGPRWVAAVYSDTPQTRQQQMHDEMFAGISLARRPETYRQLKDRQQQLQSRQRPLLELQKFNVPDKLGPVLEGAPQATGWLPVKGPKQDMVALFHGATPVAIVDLRPWQ